MKPEDVSRIRLITNKGNEWVTFSDFANELKRQHDQTGGGYPFEVVLGVKRADKDYFDDILLRKYFKKVWDWKAKVENHASKEWDFPLTVTIGRIATLEFNREDVKFVEPSDRQMNIEEQFEEVEPK